MSRMGPGSVRLFLAFLVLLHHSTPLRLGSIAVGLFFCLSGFWVSEIWLHRYRHLDRPYLEFIQARWLRIFPVFCVCTVLAAVIFASGLIEADAKVVYSVPWLITQPLIAGSSYFGRLLPPTWSLDVEMQFYLVAPLLVGLVMKANARLAIAVAAALLIYTGVLIACGRPLESTRLDASVGLFVVGMVGSKIRLHPSGIHVAIGVAVATAMLGLVVAVPATRPLLVRRGSDTVVTSSASTAIMFVGLFLAMLPLIFRSVRMPSNKLDRFFGDLSYPLYLVHWIPRDWYYARVHAGHNALISLVINFTAAVTAAVLILLLIDRPIQRRRAKWVRSHDRSGHGDAAAS